MSKKIVGIVFVIIIVIAIVACIVFQSKNTSSNEANINNSDITPVSADTSLTISDVIAKFEENGIEVTLEETKPYYTMIGAIDGEMFYMDGSPVKLYVFESEETYNEALSTYSILEDMPKKDLIVIDTASTEALQIFDTL